MYIGDISICELDSICKARLALLQSIDKKFNNTTNDNGGGETSIDTQGYNKYCSIRVLLLFR